MKETGIVRKLDSLGRIVLPAELRKKLNLEDRCPIEIFVQQDKIILQKYAPSDIFTGEFEDLVEYKGLKVSKSTICELARIADMEISKTNK